jgi:hypothetical protein
MKPTPETSDTTPELLKPHKYTFVFTIVVLVQLAVANRAAAGQSICRRSVRADIWNPTRLTNADTYVVFDCVLSKRVAAMADGATRACLAAPFVVRLIASHLVAKHRSTTPV